MFLKIETLFVAVLAIFVFFVTFFQFDRRWFQATLFTVVFLGIYTLISYLIQKFQAVEEKYIIGPKHLEVVRKQRNQTKKEKALLKDISYHKLDKFFLGGYVLTKKGDKHLLFFNNKEEIEKFEKLLKKK